DAAALPPTCGGSPPYAAPGRARPVAPPFVRRVVPVPGVPRVRAFQIPPSVLCYRRRMPHRATPAAPAALAAPIDRLRLATVILTLSLIALGIAWEPVLAPLRPGGSLLAFKVLPLVLALPAFMRGRIRRYQLWS